MRRAERPRYAPPPLQIPHSGRLRVGSARAFQPGRNKTGDQLRAIHAPLRDRIAKLQVQQAAISRGHAEYGDMAVKAFELSQRLQQQWVKADSPAKRQILEIVCSNLVLDGVTLVPTMRKPFDLTAEGLILAKHRGDRI